MTERNTQRDITTIRDQLERLRKADTGIPSGTAFPSGPSTNFLFFRTDLGWLCYYDGTRWLTENEYTLDADANATPADGTAPYEWQLRQDYNPYVTRVTTSVNVATTNNSTNNWTVRFRGLNLARTTISTMHDFSTSLEAANTWLLLDAVPTTSQTPTNDNTLQLQVIKVGAPGAITIASASIAYRLIIT